MRYVRDKRSEDRLETASAVSLNTHETNSFNLCLGKSAVMQQIEEQIQQVAIHQTSVLITGESGTGKEVVARKIHHLSLRQQALFVPVNCGAIPADLLESELFGHEKGAFTGAISTRKGRFEIAEGGTLFLDEIGDMSLTMQVKLLRVLQEKRFERVGSNKSIHCNVRIIAATHRDLEAMIKNGLFREDLFFRLNVFPIQVPPLRDHLSDLSVLIDHFVALQVREGRCQLRLSSATLMALSRYSWGGNIRELSNLIERLSIIKPDGFIRLSDLPSSYREMADDLVDDEHDVHDNTFKNGQLTATNDSSIVTKTSVPKEGLNLKQHMVNIEYQYIMSALKQADGVVAQAARLLQMRRTTLVEKIRKLEKSAQL